MQAPPTNGAALAPWYVARNGCCHQRLGSSGALAVAGWASGVAEILIPEPPGGTVMAIRQGRFLAGNLCLEVPDNLCLQEQYAVCSSR